MAKVLVKFEADFGRNGNLSGMFICDINELINAYGRKVEFGDVLGKHSNLVFELEYPMFTVCADKELIEKLEETFGKNIVGYNPLSYLQ